MIALAMMPTAAAGGSGADHHRPREATKSNPLGLLQYERFEAVEWRRFRSIRPVGGSAEEGDTVGHECRFSFSLASGPSQ